MPAISQPQPSAPVHPQIIAQLSSEQPHEPPPTNHQPRDPYHPRSTTHQPPLSGWLATYYRYYKGKKLGPYYVRRWKSGGKLHKEYIKPADVERVRAACQANRERRKAQQIFSLKANCLFRNFSFLMHIEKLLNKNRPIPADFVAHVQRINEDPFTPGRPPLRRPRLFMVPRITNRFLNELKRITDLAWITAHQPKTDNRRLAVDNFMVPHCSDC